MPEYPLVSLRLCLTAQDIEKHIANKGAIEDTPSIDFLTSGSCHNYSINLGGEIILIDEHTRDSTRGIATLFDSGYIPDAKAGQNMTLVFRNPISNITVYPDDSVESNCFSMNFDSFLADVKVEETNQIDYSADGSVKVCESAGACSVTLVFDERSSNYP